MATRKQVYRAIDSERALQEQMVRAKQGKTPEFKPLECYVLYMEDYMRELRETLSRVWGPRANEIGLNTLRKIVALGVVAMEQHGAPERKFPVQAKINGKVYMVGRKGAREIGEMERLFGIAPVKAEGAKVAFDPKPKAKKRKKARKHK